MFYFKNLKKINYLNMAPKKFCLTYDQLKIFYDTR